MSDFGDLIGVALGSTVATAAVGGIGAAVRAKIAARGQTTAAREETLRAVAPVMLARVEALEKRTDSLRAEAEASRARADSAVAEARVAREATAECERGRDADRSECDREIATVRAEGDRREREVRRDVLKLARRLAETLTPEDVTAQHDVDAVIARSLPPPKGGSDKT